jgi:hypothetical protein
MKIFGREPALILAFLAALVQVVSTFVVHLTPEQQSVLNAVAVGVAGLITAVVVHDGVQAAVLGLVQAVLSLAVGFGAHIEPGNQAVIMTAVAAGIALWVRDRVTAPVPAAEVSLTRVP